MEENKLHLELPGLDSAGKLLTDRRKPIVVYLLAFFVPVVLMAILWAIAGVKPFGTRMILAHDQWHQYYPFFVNFRERLLSGHSLFYSWNTGMGTNYLGLYGYYLASPLNWLGLLVPERLVLYYYTLTVLVRIGLAGLFFAIFLRHTFQRCELVQLFFSTMYALCAFLMGYYWNAIWLDTVALLPLVVLGTLQLLSNNKYVLYMTSLALSVICSYYIGLFVCYFVFLLFLCYNFVNWDDFAGFRSRLWRIAFFTIIALGLSAVVTGPALVGLMNTSSADNSFPKEFAVNIAKDPTILGVLDAIRQVIANSAAALTPTTMTGLPNIYCGVISVLMAMVYCCCRHIPWREKLCCCLLLLFFTLSFIIRWFDYVWHGFHFPNMLPHRFSFLFSFVILFMAYRAYTQLDRVRSYQLLFLLPMLGLYIYCVVSADKLSSVIPTVGLLLLGAVGLLLYSRRIITRNVLALVLCVCLLVEAGVSAALGVRAVSTTDGSIYPRAAEDVNKVLEVMNEREAETKDFWRAELTLNQTLNDPTLLSMPGVSVFASTCNSGVSTFLKGIGLDASARGNRYVYSQSDPAVNLLLNIKYLVDREGLASDPTHFKTVTSSNEVLLLENQDYLPMGWAVNSAALSYDPGMSGTIFKRIEDFYGKLTGQTCTLYQPMEVFEVRCEGNAKSVPKNSGSYSFESDGDDSSRFCLSYVMDRAGSLSLHTQGSNVGKLYLYLNDSYLCSYNDKYGHVRYFDGLKQGDVVTLRYRCDKPEKTSTVTVNAARFDETAFRNLRSSLSNQVLEVESRSDTELVGTIRSQTESLFFTTIPYESGWSATVDGESVRITPVAEAFVAFRLPAGSHEIRLSYETPGLRVSFIISICALALYLVFVVLSLLLRLTKRPMTKIRLSMEGMDEMDVYGDPDSSQTQAPAQPFHETEEDYDYVPERSLYDPEHPLPAPPQRNAPSLEEAGTRALPEDTGGLEQYFRDPSQDQNG